MLLCVVLKQTRGGAVWRAPRVRRNSAHAVGEETTRVGPSALWNGPMRASRMSLCARHAIDIYTCVQARRPGVSQGSGNAARTGVMRRRARVQQGQRRAPGCRACAAGTAQSRVWASHPAARVGGRTGRSGVQARCACRLMRSNGTAAPRATAAARPAGLREGGGGASGGARMTLIRVASPRASPVPPTRHICGTNSLA